jgi:hypothetical protein
MLISEEYRQQQKELHKNPHYGVASVVFAPVVAKAIKQYGITEILDYGAGKLRLKQEFDRAEVPVEYKAYEPANPNFSDDPEPAQCVVCIDVLEHIEPDYLMNVLDHIKTLSKEYAFLTVHTGPAGKFLPDGRNAHLTQKPATWWVPKIAERFNILKHIDFPDGMILFCGTKEVVDPLKWPFPEHD